MENENTNSWIFQSNPTKFNIVDAVNDLQRIDWAVNQHKGEIKASDIVYIWASGADGGIIATGIIESDPSEIVDKNDKYAIQKSDKNTYLGVSIKILNKFTGNPAKRKLLQLDPRLKDMQIFKNAQGTNFSLTKEEAIAIESIISQLNKYEKYTKEDFLKEVYIEETKYNTLVELLTYKKNIILTGAPGVGKTFLATRLAYAIIGEKDTSRVKMVQFHQSYSYEDFIMGYRPTSTGFELKNGPFYEFCNKASNDSEREYFFIIDEINRGNLSKIFGELFMLIEKDKRGESLNLVYQDDNSKAFSVPKNVYIIGLMNTADRSLAMMDYALRRRFAFFELEPAFHIKAFTNIVDTSNNDKFGKLIKQVMDLNEEISKDEALGAGFKIGHSYFCIDENVTDSLLFSIVKYELIPLLSEYWFDEPSKISTWSDNLLGALK